MDWSPEKYIAALNFASFAHRTQTVPGTENEAYLRHLATVTAEILRAIALRDDIERPDLAVQCAILHDSVEDHKYTGLELGDIRREFGDEVADGVGALSKNEALPKEDRMTDSLARIRTQPPEVWMVKLADRITNLQPPPSHWSDEKVAKYREVAWEIHRELGSACPVLGPRLLEKIEVYPGELAAE